MNVHAPPADAAMPIRRGTLMALYAVVPLAALVWLVDVTLGGGALKRWLPSSPVSWPVYGLVFGMPHICASLVGLLDARVVRYHAQALAVSVAVSALAAWAVVGLLDETWGQRLMVVWTMFHVLGQQTGLALAGLGPSAAGSCAAKVWRHGLALAAGTLALALGGESGAGGLVRAPGEWILASGVLLLAAWPLAMWLQRRAGQAGTDGRMVLATQAMCFTSWWLTAQDYPLLAVLIPRLVHDSTAFHFYIQHAGSPAARGNALLVRLRGLPVWHRAGMVPLGIGLALLLSLLPAAASIAATVLHYCIEGRLWRRGAPMRAGLRFT
jgi:hypothetical protein